MIELFGGASLPKITRAPVATLISVGPTNMANGIISFMFPSPLAEIFSIRVDHGNNLSIDCESFFNLIQPGFESKIKSFQETFFCLDPSKDKPYRMSIVGLLHMSKFHPLFLRNTNTHIYNLYHSIDRVLQCIPNRRSIG